MLTCPNMVTICIDTCCFWGECCPVSLTKHILQAKEFALKTLSQSLKPPSSSRKSFSILSAPQNLHHLPSITVSGCYGITICISIVSIVGILSTNEYLMRWDVEGHGFFDDNTGIVIFQASWSQANPVRTQSTVTTVRSKKNHVLTLLVLGNQSLWLLSSQIGLPLFLWKKTPVCLLTLTSTTYIAANLEKRHKLQVQDVIPYNFIVSARKKLSFSWYSQRPTRGA